MAGRINRLIAFAIVCQLCMVGYQLYQYRAGIWQQRQHELSNITSLAASIVNSEYALAQAGKQSVADAQAQAKARLGALRYNQDDYLWINDMEPRMVMHPVRPDLNGKMLDDYKDPTGLKLFVAFVDVVKAKGAGFVAYQWPRPGSDAPQPKLSYVAEFKPWGWIIGTGVYVDDLDALFLTQVKTQGTLVLLMMLFCGLVSFMIGRKLASTVTAMSLDMEHLAAGKLDVPITPDANSRELGRMSRALLVFQRSAVEKRAMEAETRAERERNEAARQKAAEEAIQGERARVTASFGTALARLANKDLCVRLNEDVPPAYRQLQADFNKAMDALELALGAVHASAETIATGTRQLASATDDLSRRTESQAASLEESTAAMSELSQAVNSTADSSTQTKDIISAAKNESVLSTEIVQQAVTSMGGIQDSSRKISQIITVINEIAFQTNLLALNAGVEAARAGDAGRGFAVVASEVRALAQRSADAAKEIGTLIAASTGNVDTGVERVNATGQAIQRVMSQISVIDDGIANIAGQAIEQAITLKQVNTAISEIDQSTQKNAAMAEEATAACRLLAEESQCLAAMVGEFKLRVSGGNAFASQGNRNARLAVA